MTRRSSAMILATAVALAAAGSFAFVAGPGVSPLANLLAKKPERVMLVYVGADDCAPCRIWQRDHAPTLRSPSFAGLIYREVKSPRLLDVMKDDYWPDDLRRLRTRLGPGAAVPLWLVIADGVIVGRGRGASEWSGRVLPILKSLVRQPERASVTTRGSHDQRVAERAGGLVPDPRKTPRVPRVPLAMSASPRRPASAR